MPAESFFYDGMTGRDLLELTARYHPERIPRPGSRPSPCRPTSPWASGPRACGASWPSRRRSCSAGRSCCSTNPSTASTWRASTVAQRLILRRRDEGATILITSHLLPTLTPVADDIRLLDGGRITAEYRRGEYTRAERELEALFHARYTNLFPDRKIN